MLRRAEALLAGLALLGPPACSCSEAPPDPPTSGGPEVAPAPPPPVDRVAFPPRRPIRGLAGLQSSSTVTFFEQPDKPHTLTATFQFPERVRLHLALAGERAVDRVLYYRAGARGFFMEERESVSRELAGSELSDLFLETELRRAAFLWPDGFEWAGDGAQRSVELAGLGRLTAVLGDGGRPTTMSAQDGGGRAVASLEVIAWQPSGSRVFPSRFVLAAQGARVWTEEVTKVETVLNFVDDFFVPPDRRVQH